MKILKQNFKWNGSLKKRASTKYIILHHRAGNGDAASIHKQHLNLGYSGIGYNFYVRKDGRIYAGRPIDCCGAHTTNFNSVSVGICFEGNFELESNMQSAQFLSGAELLKYLKLVYPDAKVVMHRSLNSTACPGKHFPFDELTKKSAAVFTSIYDITHCYKSYGIVSDDYGMRKEIGSNYDCRLYWLARKMLQVIQEMPHEAKRSVNEYTDINDIVWELGNREIITDKNGFIAEVKQNPNGRLYWLARKGLTYIRNRD